MRRLLLALLMPALCSLVAPVQAQTSPTPSTVEPGAQAPGSTSAPVPAPVTGLDPAPQIIDAANSAQGRYAQALDELAQAKEELQQTSDELLAKRNAKGNTALLKSDPVLKAAIAPFQTAVEDAEKELAQAEGSLRAYSLLRSSARHGGVQVIQVPAYVPDGAASEASEPEQPIVGKPAQFKKKGKSKTSAPAQKVAEPVSEDAKPQSVQAAPVEHSPTTTPASEDVPQGPHSEFAAPGG